LPPKFSKSPKDPNILSGSDNAPALHPRTPIDLLFLQPGILDQLHDSIIITDMQGTITGCNQAVTRMYGYTQQELIGQSVDIFYPPEDLDTVRDSVFRLLMEKGQVTTKQRNKTKSGAEIYIHLTITMVRDSDSNPVGLVGLSQDITERKLTELALRQSDQKLRGLAQVCPDFFFTTRADGWTDWVSPKFYEHTGAIQGGGDGLTWADYLHPEDREKTAMKWMAAVKRGDPFEAEHRFRVRDGKYRWFRSRATPVRNAKGEIERWVGIGSDIHNQKQAEAALRESERKFKDLAEAIPHSVWITSAEGLAEYSNQRWLELTGLSLEESLGHGWLSAIHPDDAAQTMVLWEKAAALGETFEAEYRIKTPDGTYRWQLARGVRHRSDDGHGDKWFGTCTDIHDHKNAMEALRDREATLRNFYDHSPFAMGITEFLGNDVLMIYANPATSEWFGLKPGAMNGYTLRGIGTSSDELEAVLGSYRECLQTGKPVVTEYLRVKDGSQHWVRETIAPLDTAASGNPRFTYVTKDITSYKRAEERLRRNEERFRTALNNSPVVVFSQDKELRHTWVYNPALGFKAEDVIGKRDIELCERRADADLTEALKRRVIETGMAVREEVIIHYRGVPLAYHLAINPLRNAAGEIEGITCTATDITERKQAEASLRQQQLVLATLIESTTDYVYMKDRAGRYVFLNSSAANSMGKTVQEIVGKDDTFLFPADSARLIMKKDDELMAAGKSAVFEETHSIGGSTQHLFTSKSICRDAAGAVIGIVGISRDVTEHKEAENALISRDLNEAAARMAHALAHEINNPLAAITNAIYLLQQGTEILPSKELLNAAEHSLSRITKITRHMIGLYNRNARPHKINVQEIVEDTLASVESQVIARGIQIEKTLKPCEFNGIDTDLRQLFSALMENAIEQGRGLIKLRLSPTKGPRAGFRLAIADNGPGITPQHRHQLFEPFFSTKTEPASGLGLWVTRSIAEKYEGYIRLRTSTREGASGTCVMVVMFSRRPRRRAGEQVS